MEKLIAMAREINPELPSDLSGHLVTISMSIDGVYATAIPLDDTEFEPE